MVEIADIRDEESLRAWLEARPDATRRGEAVWIAHRCAMRVWPVYAETLRRRSRKDDLTRVPVLRACLISGVAAVSSTPEIQTAAAARASAADAAARAAAFTAAARAAASATDAAAIAARATAAAAAAARAAGRAAAALAAGVLANTPLAFLNDWDAVRRDCRLIEAGEPLAGQPLWHDAAVPTADFWPPIRDNLLKRDPNWRFWTDWYDAALDPAAHRGHPAKLLEEIALKEKDFWQGSDKKVNARIAGVVLDFGVAETINAEVITENPETERLRVEATSQLGSGRLEDVQSKMRDAASIFDEEGGENGPYGDLAPEVALVRRAATLNDPRPIQLYDACRRAARRTRRKKEQQYCPSDALVDDFVQQLEETAVDLMGFNEDVRNVATNRATSNLAEAPPDAAKVLVPAAEELAEISEGDLREELPELARNVADPDVPADERKEDLYVTSSRILRIYQGAKRVLSETDDVTKKAANISKNTAIAVASSVAVVRAIQFILSLF